jgi:hypothetical protein
MAVRRTPRTTRAGDDGGDTSSVAVKADVIAGIDDDRAAGVNANETAGVDDD